ncbi:hypothetical protein G6O69_17405 [Pseudenhygromyxa sp. WMMC2535]|uniref:hypothetical protein n=1 Tax=Pseudenhygromyxa sp. WMMC2535 TaxID=2712867 RepID=UPI0015582A7F|nr:hypothetical protein [Pseudenhygromyxa sp. WMMC2535]NVB39623.1 hypothetical protein [Pseudenhygromyxa sp. WMMC2535]
MPKVRLERFLGFGECTPPGMISSWEQPLVAGELVARAGLQAWVKEDEREDITVSMEPYWVDAEDAPQVRGSMNSEAMSRAMDAAVSPAQPLVRLPSGPSQAARSMVETHGLGEALESDEDERGEPILAGSRRTLAAVVLVGVAASLGLTWFLLEDAPGGAAREESESTVLDPDPLPKPISAPPVVPDSRRTQPTTPAESASVRDAESDKSGIPPSASAADDPEKSSDGRGVSPPASKKKRTRGNGKKRGATYAWETPECAQYRKSAEMALEDGRWKYLELITTEEAKCWADRGDRLDLLGTALFQLELFDECVSETRSSRDPRVVKWQERCKIRKLAQP